jgi:hypothetical protein
MSLETCVTVTLTLPSEVVFVSQQPQSEETERLVMLVPKSLKRQLKLIARDLDDIGDDPATITRVAIEILQDGVDKYAKNVRKRVEKAS